MFVGRSIFLKVIFFIFLKVDSTAAELAVSSPYPNIGIINPDHKGNNFMHLRILGTKVGKYNALINPVPSYLDDLFLFKISSAHD